MNKIKVDGSEVVLKATKDLAKYGDLTIQEKSCEEVRDTALAFYNSALKSWSESVHKESQRNCLKELSEIVTQYDEADVGIEVNEYSHF